MSKTLDDYAFKDSSRRAKPASPKKKEKQTTLLGGMASRELKSRPEDMKRARNKCYKPTEDDIGDRDLGDAELAPELDLDNAIEQDIRAALPPLPGEPTPRKKLGYARKPATPKPPGETLIVRSTPKADKKHVAKSVKPSAQKSTPRVVAVVADSSSSDSDIQPVPPAKRSMSAQSRSKSASQEKTGLTSEMDTLGPSIFPEAYEFESADDQPLVSPERNRAIKASSSAKKPPSQRPIDNSVFYAPSPVKDKGKKRLMDSPKEGSDSSIQIFSPSPAKKLRPASSKRTVLSDDDLPDPLDLTISSPAKAKSAAKAKSTQKPKAVYIGKKKVVSSSDPSDEEPFDMSKVPGSGSKAKSKAKASPTKAKKKPRDPSPDLSDLPDVMDLPKSPARSPVKAKPSQTASTSKSKPIVSAFSEEEDFLPPADEAHLYSAPAKKKKKKAAPVSDEETVPKNKKKRTSPSPKKKSKKRAESDDSDLEQFLVESDVEERVTKSAKKRRKKKVVSEEDEEPDDLEMDFEVLRPTKLRSKSTLSKKTEARNALLAKIRNKRSKAKSNVIQDSDEEQAEAQAVNSSEEDPPDQFIGDEDDSSSEESVNSEDFIVEDGEDQEDVRRMIPAQFTSEFTQKPIFHFRSFCQLSVLRFLFPNVDDFGDNLDQSRQKIAQLIQGILSSLVKSQAWKSKFVQAIELPELSEEVLDYTREGCDACRLGGRKSKVEITLSGRYYDRVNFEPKEKANYNSDTSDSDGEKGFAGTEIHTFAIGSECLKKTRCYHDLRHFEWNRVQELGAITEQYRKTDNVHPRPKDAGLAKKWEQQRQRDCDVIMDKLEQQGFVRKNFNELQTLMDFAHQLYAH